MNLYNICDILELLFCCVDYYSLLYVNGGVLFIVEIIATFKIKPSKSYSNAKVFRYYLYFMTAILLWMMFN